jgi:hypothetical protein
MRRPLLIALVSIPVLIVGGHTLLWRAATHQLSAGFKGWAAEERTQGWTVNSAKTLSGGWPLSATLTIPELFVSGGKDDLPGGLTWSADKVVLQVSLLSPHQLTLSFEGAQRLRLGNGPDIPFTADSMQVQMPIEPGVPPRTADLTARNLRAGMPAATNPAPGQASAGLTAGLVQIHASMVPSAAQGEPAISFALRSDDIGLPPDRNWALGQRMGSFTIEGALNGPLPHSPGLTHRATAWRDGGGSLEIRHLAMGWGPLGVTGSATLALDDQLQPMGTGMARFVGYDAALDELASHGVVKPGAAVAAKAVLSLIARVPDGGRVPEVEVPLTLQKRVLAVRQIPLVRLPELDWPAQTPGG